MAVREEITTEEKANLCLAKLEALDEDWIVAQQNLEWYCHRKSNAINKQVQLRSFQKGDLVLRIRTSMIIGKKKEKLEPIRKAPSLSRRSIRMKHTPNDCRRTSNHSAYKWSFPKKLLPLGWICICKGSRVNTDHVPQSSDIRVNHQNRKAPSLYELKLWTAFTLLTSTRTNFEREPYSCLHAYKLHTIKPLMT